jgi:response regulator NasT
LDFVAVAVGILMHRHGLGQAQAINRLHMLVAHHGGTVQGLARTLVQAQETLAATSAP